MTVMTTALLSTSKKVRFDAEKHIMIDNAKLIKKDVTLGEELVFPLESKDDFGRIAAQTAKQVPFLPLTNSSMLGVEPQDWQKTWTASRVCLRSSKEC